MASVERQRTKVPRSLWLSLAAVFVGAGSIVVALPLLAGDRGPAPPVWMLLTGGLAIAALVAPALSTTITKGLRLPARVAIYAIAYNTLVVLVKFVLAPLGLYETNREVPLEGYVNITDAGGAAISAVIVFGLYALVYWVLFRVVRRRVAGLPPFHEPKGRRSRRRIGVAVAAAAFLLAALSGMAILAIPLILASGTADYLRSVFTSGLSLLVALALVGASILVGITFDTAAAGAEAVRDAGVLVALFWVGLAFIALYHVLWVVFILVLAGTWPLRVVVPK